MISLTDITKEYVNGTDTTRVLKGISLEIHKGEFVAIMGPSGSGKSTLMHIIGALDAPTSGMYLLDGTDVSNTRPDELSGIRRTKIGFVFQAFHLLPRASVLRNVALPLMYANIPPEERDVRARTALRAASMEDRFQNLSNQLSGGQMQRVAIARALVNDPAIILADEPTGNLDSKTGALVLETFRKLNAEGRTIVLITHEQDVADAANRVITLKDGNIVNV